MPRKKIAFIIPSFRPGGAEKMLLTAANYLSRKGYEIHIIFLKEGGAFLAELSPEIKRWDINNGSIYFSALAVRKIVNRIKPDIFFPWMGYLNAYLAFFKPLFRKKMAWVCRESSIPSLMNKQYRFSFLYRFFYRFYNRYDRIVCQSAYMADDLVRNFRVKKTKTEIINNPVDFSAAELKIKDPAGFRDLGEEKYRLLYVGGLHVWKRVHLLPEVLALLPPEYSLTIIGEGNEKENIEKSIHANKVSGRVRIISGCTNPFPYYAKASCLILCSTFEGFPNVVIEAMAAGCPAIGYGIEGGANDALAGYGGYVVDDGNMKGLLNTIDEVCRQNIPDRKKISEVCREKYDLNKIMLQYEELLNKICAG